MGQGGLGSRKLSDFSGKTLMIRATTLERKHYKIMLFALFPRLVNKVSSWLPSFDFFTFNNFSDFTRIECVDRV